MGTEGFTSATEHGGLSGAETGHTAAFLGTYFAMGAVDFVAVFGAGCSLAGCVALEDDGSMEDVST